jgi:hypothetical protein
MGTGKRARAGQLAEPVFDRDLPGQGCAEENLIRLFTDGGTRRSRKRGLVGEPPNEGVRIEQEWQSLLPAPDFVLGQRLEE